jgi:hypothetical protein
MIKGIDVNQRIEFSFVDDIEPKTIFVFRPLDSVEQMEMVSEDGSVKIGGKDIFPYLEKVIVDVKNFTTNDVKAALRQVPPVKLAELIKFSGTINNVSGQDQKN